MWIQNVRNRGGGGDGGGDGGGGCDAGYDGGGGDDGIGQNDEFFKNVKGS